MCHSKLKLSVLAVVVLVGCGESPEQHQARLGQVGKALTGFYENHNVFPLVDGLPKVPARVNQEETPARIGLSWRVHLLPFLGQESLYSKFNLDEPWDSAQNKAMIAQMPEVYKSPGVSAPGMTSLHAVIFESPEKNPFGDVVHSCFRSESSGKASGERKTFRWTDCIDGTANTIAFVEAGFGVATEWTKPGGLEMHPGSCRSSLGDMSRGFYVVLVNGDVKSIRGDIDEKLLESLVTANGREVPDWTNVVPK